MKIVDVGGGLQGFGAFNAGWGWYCNWEKENQGVGGVGVRIGLMTRN
jgi:hypothetical protein